MSILWVIARGLLLFVACQGLVNAQVSTTNSVWVTTGQRITPTAATGSGSQPLRTYLRPDNNADGANAVTTALNPDETRLLVLTLGYNTGFFKVDGTPIVYPILDPQTGKPTTKTPPNAEWMFVYDVTGPTPVELQKINIRRTY